MHSNEEQSSVLRPDMQLIKVLRIYTVTSPCLEPLILWTVLILGQCP